MFGWYVFLGKVMPNLSFAGPGCLGFHAYVMLFSTSMILAGECLLVPGIS